MQKKNNTKEGNNEILQCDTLSTESPSNSDASISPINGDGNVDDDNEKKWLRRPSIGGDGDDEDENLCLHLNLHNLNDGILISHIGGSITIPSPKQEKAKENEILLAPSTIEERQNEKYARKVGINL